MFDGAILPNRPDDYVSIDEVTVHAAILRDLVRIWDAHTRNESYDEVRENWENPVFPALPDPLVLHFFVEALNAGLRPFQARVNMLSPDGNELPFPPLPEVSLYSALCLQLAVDIKEGDGYHRCARPNCRKLFRRQRGLKESGSHRTKGVLYCSPDCAGAEASRKHRQKKTALALASDGTPVEQIAMKLDTQPDDIRRWLGSPKEKGKRR